LAILFPFLLKLRSTLLRTLPGIDFWWEGSSFFCLCSFSASQIKVGPICSCQNTCRSSNWKKYHKLGWQRIHFEM